jgi:electron transfer flavoprotein beta subunit
MLAALLGWPQVTFAAKVSEEGSAALLVERETDTGTEIYKASLPCVVTADLRLNEPRYATLPNIMKAKKKPLEILEAASLGVDLAPRNHVQAVSDPPVRPPGKLVASVDDLLLKLKSEVSAVVA